MSFASAYISRLIRKSRVILAVGQFVEVAMAAVMEPVAPRLADWPFAHFVAERHERNPEADRYFKIVDRHQRRGFDHLSFHRDETLVAIHGYRALTASPWLVACSRSRGTSLLCLRSGASRPRSGGKLESVDLAYHRVAGEAAELCGYLPCGETVLPEFLEEFNPFVCPAHLVALCLLQYWGKSTFTIASYDKNFCGLRLTSHSLDLAKPLVDEPADKERGERDRDFLRIEL